VAQFATGPWWQPAGFPKQETFEVPPERSAPWHSAQELVPPLEMKVSVADVACWPPEGTATQPGGLTMTSGESSFAHPEIPAKANRRISDSVESRRSRKEWMGVVLSPPVLPWHCLYFTSFLFLSAPALIMRIYSMYTTPVKSDFCCKYESGLRLVS